MKKQVASKNARLFIVSVAAAVILNDWFVDSFSGTVDLRGWSIGDEVGGWVAS